ncbi:ABC transporter permease [Pseudonocardia endophytica]|uniref:Osmoprotectant transport system permease protein n=1 Tax=Pseudonocardia endophytica TaxID=401976 RepID=A0A4R1HQR8_PSEEN|nr:ABC transporter permease [Pseudonocardia endophytica]TCK24917.1 osmoprotectant transport system permease protein [Pseudonocardia endophytica]
MSLPGQVIPNFSGPNCAGQFFCWDWVGANWAEVLQPALIQHIWISVLAVLFGLVISIAAALYAVRNSWFERGFSALATFLYTVPALAFFLLMVPITGLTITTVLIGLTSYTLLLLFANAVTGLRSAPPETLAAADGMGLTRNQVLFKVQLPLALPSIMAGVRIAVVTVISLETVAAQVVQAGLGTPLFNAQRNVFTTGLIVTGVLAIALALVADGLVVLLQRAVTPWVQARR